MQRRALLERALRATGLQERFLQGIFGILLIAQEVIGNRLHPRRMHTKHLFKRGPARARSRRDVDGQRQNLSRQSIAPAFDPLDDAAMPGVGRE
jgi:hypothetical protein